MCGIVGYTGPRPCVDPAGRAAPARIPRIRFGRDRHPGGRRHRDPEEPKGRSAPRRAGREGAGLGDVRRSATPAGRPTAALRTRTPTRTGGPRGGRPQRDRREPPDAEGDALGAGARVRFGDRHRGDRPPPGRVRPQGLSLEEAGARTVADTPRLLRLPRRLREGAGTLVGARLNCPMVVGLGRGGVSSSPPTSRPSLPHPERPLPRGRRDGGGRPRQGVRITDFLGNPGERAAAAHRLVPRDGRKGRLPPLHAQGDPRAAARRSSTRWPAGC